MSVIVSVYSVCVSIYTHCVQVAYVVSLCAADLSAEAQQMRDTARRFARTELLPNAQTLDRKEQVSLHASRLTHHSGIGPLFATLELVWHTFYF